MDKDSQISPASPNAVNGGKHIRDTLVNSPSSVAQFFRSQQNNVSPLGETEEAYYLTEIQENLLPVYRLGRILKRIALIQIVFISVFAIWSPYFVIILPLPMCGWYGASHWYYYALYVYSLYVGLEIAGGIVSVVLLNAVTFLALRILYIIMNICILRYSNKLAAYTLILDDEDREFLTSHPILKEINKTPIWS